MSAYPGYNGNAGGDSGGGYRAATPNSRGQYSDATLNELESQNDSEVAGILGKVKTLKNVSVASAHSEKEKLIIFCL